MNELIARLTIQAIAHEDIDAFFPLADAYIDNNQPEEAERILKAEFGDDLFKAVSFLYKSEISDVRILKRSKKRLYEYFKERTFDKVFIDHCIKYLLSKEQIIIVKLGSDKEYYDRTLGFTARKRVTGTFISCANYNLCKTIGEFKEAKRWKHLINYGYNH